MTIRGFIGKKCVFTFVISARTLDPARLDMLLHPWFADRAEKIEIY